MHCSDIKVLLKDQNHFLCQQTYLQILKPIILSSVNLKSCMHSDILYSILKHKSCDNDIFVTGKVQKDIIRDEKRLTTNLWRRIMLMLRNLQEPRNPHKIFILPEGTMFDRSVFTAYNVLNTSEYVYYFGCWLFTFLLKFLAFITSFDRIVKKTHGTHPLHHLGYFIIKKLFMQHFILIQYFECNDVRDGLAVMTTPWQYHPLRVTQNLFTPGSWSSVRGILS